MISMRQNAISQLIQRWMNDPGLLEAMRTDLEAAVQQTGVQLTAEEWEGLCRIDWRLTHWVTFLLLLDLEVKLAKKSVAVS